ncbi:DMT family transporter [Rhodococcus sp. NBC_00297]|uniref:DMT family transporter n=1 Tax=Rhodococcus sp. NBC_00297 TaxID=2976005 RepID=UPI002E2B74FB|nr:EamA family transporter [Rhodococcus sp. NBC_00297]
MNRAVLGSSAVLGASVLWGTTGTVASFAPSIGALAVGAAAMGIGGLLQAALNVAALRRACAALTARWAVVLSGGLCVAIYPLAFYSSMRVGGIAVGTAVSLGSAPLASAVIDRVLDRTHLTRAWIVAAALGIGGTMLMSSGVHSPGDTSAAAGIGLGLVAGLTYAGYSRSLRELMNGGIGRGASTGAVFGVGGIALLPIVLASAFTSDLSARPLTVIAYLAIVPMFGGYILFSHGLARIDAATATTLTLSEPVFATALAVIVVGERPTIAGWIGIALIMAGLAVLMGTARPAPPHTRSTANTFGNIDNRRQYSRSVS